MNFKDQLFYWTHMLDEAMADKSVALVCEDIEGKNINRAEKWIKDNCSQFLGQEINGRVLRTPRDVVSQIREEIPASRLPFAKDKDGKEIVKIRPNGQAIKKGTCRWMLGIVRIYFTDLMDDSENAVQNTAILNDIIKVIAERHAEDFEDSDLKGLSFEQLKKSFQNEIQQIKSDERSSVRAKAKNLTLNKRYTIIPIESFDDAKRFSEYVSWCVTKRDDYFLNYTKNGTRKFYFCVRDDFKTVAKEKGQGYPKDDYGSSMLAILIDEDGSMNSNDGCTSRWNCGGRVYEPDEIQELIGVDFYETFKPLDIQTIMAKYEKMRVKEYDEANKALEAITIDEIKNQFYVFVENNKIVKYCKCCKNTFIKDSKFFHVEGGRILEGAPLEVEGTFNCSDSRLTSLEGAPRKVGGSFNCSDNQLTSLEGAPLEVGGSFDCSGSKLTSLEGAPSEIKGSFDCCYNQLKSLEGAPQKVGGNFDCDNSKLTSLKGAPQKVGGGFSCSYNQLTSLEGAPRKVGGSFNCIRNPLASLEGAPREVGGSFNCFYCELTSLKGAPRKVGSIFECSYNKLTSLEGAPLEVAETFDCKKNQLTSLEGAPQDVGEDFLCNDNNLTSLEGAPLEVGRDFLCNDNNLTSLEGAPLEVGRDFLCNDNNLTSLEGAPGDIVRNFECSNNQLTSLKGAPTKVGGYFSCSKNPLSSLAGAPKIIKQGFYCNIRSTNLTDSQNQAYLAFLKNPTPDHMDKLGCYVP